MTIIKALQEVRKLLRNDVYWTRHESARDANGKFCRPDSPKACQWCLEGAVVRVTNDDTYLRIQVIDALDQTIDTHTDIPEFNDDYLTTHQDVLNVINLTIKRVNDAN